MDRIEATWRPEGAINAEDTTEPKGSKVYRASTKQPTRWTPEAKAKQAEFMRKHSKEYWRKRRAKQAAEAKATHDSRADYRPPQEEELIERTRRKVRSAARQYHRDAQRNLDRLEGNYNKNIKPVLSGFFSVVPVVLAAGVGGAILAAGLVESDVASLVWGGFLLLIGTVMGVVLNVCDYRLGECNNGLVEINKRILESTDEIDD